jgi:hypothetical protein
MRKDAFVIMPFSPTANCKDWTEIYDRVFWPTLDDLGWKCRRAAAETGSLIATIVDSLNTSTVVLADVTDRNANVFYELGVRHALSPRTIMLSQDSEHVPSDLRGYWHVQYGLMPAKITKFREDLRRILAGIEEQPDRPDNPVLDYLAIKNHSVIASENRQNVKRLNALLTEINGNIVEAQGLLSEDGSAIHRMLLTDTAVSFLLDTYYVDLGPETLRVAYEFRRCVSILTHDPKDKSVAKELRKLGLELGDRIVLARDEIQRGSFVEPITPSFMQWRVTEPSKGVTFSSCEARLRAPLYRSKTVVLGPKSGRHETKPKAPQKPRRPG